MSALWLKFCGIVRAEDLDTAVSLGVDAVGIIAVPHTPRAVSLAEAALLGDRPRGSSKLVVVFQDSDPGFIREYISAARPDLLQFHGRESSGFAESFSIPYIKAVRGEDSASFVLLAAHANSWAILIDNPAGADQLTSRLASDPQLAGRRLVLAGGLNVSDLSDRVARLRPFGVDVSRGIEGSPRMKSEQKMIEFVHAARAIKVD
ncbi:phosphoribosylanthranilate isomerase [candidate division KSB1 bacterium]|nr:phosphoribosylanthranilate isomerase [candidate division KSB1 bacterium]